MGAEQRAEATKLCPDCAEEVKAAARVCRFCGFRFEGEPDDPVE
jgi:predicted amidophosphoribosyltransferase